MISQKIFFLLLLLGALFLIFFILLPYLEAFVLAITFAVLFKPLYRKFLLWSEGSVRTSALLTILLILVFVFTPLAFLGVKLFTEASQFFTRYSSSGSLSETITSLEQSISALLPFGMKLTICDS